MTGSKQTFKHLIVGGCSFSARSIGGYPLSGCSYIDDIDHPGAEPDVWPGFLSKRMGVVSLVNLASGSHGNILLSETLIDLLDRYPYDNKDTLVVFQLSDPARLDVRCDFDDESCKFVPWTPEILPYSYRPTTMDMTAERKTSDAVKTLMETLERKGFTFYFMMMNDYTNHEYLGPVIEEFKDHLIVLDPGPSMLEFVLGVGEPVSDTDHHPNVKAHEMISEIIYEL